MNVMARLDVVVEVEEDVDAAVLQRRLADAAQDVVLDGHPKHFSIHSQHRRDDEPSPGWDLRWWPR